VVIGLALAAALVRALASRGLTTFDAPAGRLGIYVLIAALVGVVAAVLPARRAARVDMLRAITFE
jgi:putative ABC transport system permease protein